LTVRVAARGRPQLRQRFSIRIGAIRRSADRRRDRRWRNASLIRCRTPNATGDRSGKHHDEQNRGQPRDTNAKALHPLLRGGRRKAVSDRNFFHRTKITAGRHESQEAWFARPPAVIHIIAERSTPARRDELAPIEPHRIVDEQLVLQLGRDSDARQHIDELAIVDGPFERRMQIAELDYIAS
jgi:hypothetical protein